jgi:DNA-binding NtrC family response regulator
VDVEKSPRRREEVRTRILVVDDEPLIRWAASSTLSDAGFQVIEAPNVAGALKVVDTTAVDLALLDFRLSDGEGTRVLEALHRVQPACRCIVMTAFRTPELTAYAARDGVDVLDKPFGMPDLLGLVASVMAPRR